MADYDFRFRVDLCAYAFEYRPMNIEVVEIQINLSEVPEKTQRKVIGEIL